MFRLRTLPLLTAAAAACGSVAVALLGAPSARAAADPPVNTACAGTLSGTVFTLTADCDTTASLTVADGQTVDGAGHTITAHDPPGGNFTGAVLTNAAGGTSMNVRNLTIRGTGFATDCGVQLFALWFSDAGGTVTNVTVEGSPNTAGASSASASAWTR